MSKFQRRMTNEEFATLWNSCSTIEEFSEKSGHTVQGGTRKAWDLRKNHYFDLKRFGKNGKVARKAPVKKNEKAVATKIAKIVTSDSTSQPVSLESVRAAGIFDACGFIDVQFNGTVKVRTRLISRHREPLAAVKEQFGGDLTPQGDDNTQAFCLAWPDQEQAHRMLNAIRAHVTRLKPEIDLVVGWLEMQIIHKYQEEDLLRTMKVKFSTKE